MRDTQTAHRGARGAKGYADARVSQMCIARPAGLSVGHLGARGALRGVRGRRCEGRRISAAFIGARAGVVWCAGVGVHVRSRAQFARRLYEVSGVKIQHTRLSTIYLFEERDYLYNEEIR